MKTYIITFLFLLSFNRAFAQANDTIQKPPFSSPTWVAARSFIFPGWGQWYNHKKWKAAIVATTAITLGSSIYIQETRRMDAERKLHSALSNNEKYYYTRMEKFYENDRNKLIWWSVGFWLLSGLDAYVDAHLANFEVEPVASSKVSIQVNFNFFLTGKRK
ncbi:MAG: DUF5683 domain-containing protein [bacterium]|nr:DUF5683 domain-containing protein [bacterium]